MKQRYRMLKKGEILKEGDEWLDPGDQTWEATSFCGAKYDNLGRKPMGGKVGGHGDFQYRRPLPSKSVKRVKKAGKKNMRGGK